jgi:hypothetical protein
MVGAVVTIIILAVLVFALMKIVKLIRGHKYESSQTQSMGSSVLFMVMASFVASLFIGGYTVAVFMLSSFMDTWYFSQMNMILMLLVVIVSFGIYPFMLFGPAFLVGRMRGMWWGVGTFGLTLMWLIFYAFILVGLMWVTGGRTNYYNGRPDTMPMMKTETQVF